MKLLHAMIFTFIFSSNIILVADTKICTNNVLYQAIANDSPMEIKNALKLSEVINHNTLSPLAYATLLKKNKAIEVLLSNRAEIDEKAIEYAIQNRDMLIVLKLAMAFSSDLDTLYVGQTLLQHALGMGDYNAILFLIKNGASFSDEKVMGYKNYSYPQNESIVLELFEELVNRGYPIDNLWGSSPWGLTWSVENNINLINFLLQKGASPNHIFERNGINTPLLMAIHSGKINIIKTLLEAGANPNQKGTSPCSQTLKTPLAFAIEYSQYSGIDMAPIYQALMDYGAHL